VPSKKLFLGICLFGIVNLIQALLTPLTEDEAYYWVWSQNLDWGYFDHPPMVAWWISAGYSVLQSELGVRLLSVWMNAVSLVFLWKILTPKSSKDEHLFWAIIGSVTVIHVFGFLTTPDAPLLFFTLFYLYSLQKFLHKKGVLETILLAISFAGIMYSKYHGILVIAFTLIPILGKLWKNPKFYLAILGSLILYAPHILWLIQHQFSPISYHFLERSADEDFEIVKLTNYLLFILFGCSPFLVYFVHQSWWKFKTEESFQKSIKWLAIGPIVFFFFSIFKDNVQPQWLLISYIALAILTYWSQTPKENQTWIIRLGWMGIFSFLIFRILLVLPSISPLFHAQEFGNLAGKASSNKVVFEKYQEASLFKFYHPEPEVAVHRTLGNRKSQYTLWDWEESFQGQTVEYISPWTPAEKRFIGFKNRPYFVKEISNYQTYHLVEIETIEEFLSKPNELISLKIKIRNGHNHPIEFGESTEMLLSANYYVSKHYELEHSIDIPTQKIYLPPKEEIELTIQFPNISKKGSFWVCLGIHYEPIGTTYLSKPMKMNVN
jgi:4-amino-4-deoxy-L-arabinose transferase-like glycosyltransferase